MSSVHNFVPTNRATGVTIPSDGDAPIKAADVNPAIQAIGDLAANAIARVEPVATTAALAAIAAPTDGLTRYVLGFGFYTFKMAVPTITTVDPWVIAATDATPGRWISQDVFLRIGATGGGATSFRKFPAHAPFGVSAEVAFSVNQDALTGSLVTDVTTTVSGSAFTSANTGTTNTRQLYFDLAPYLIHGATLSSVYAGITPAAHGALPARMPRLAVFRYAIDPYSSTHVNLYSGIYFEDTSPNVGAFTASHEFGGTLDQNQTIDLNEYAYQCFVSNEGSTNAQNLMSVNYIKIEQG